MVNRENKHSRKQRHLVTGGTGFIGSHIVDALIARGDAVVVLDNFSTGLRKNLAHLRPQVAEGRLDIVEGDIRSTNLIKQLFSVNNQVSRRHTISERNAAFDSVFHLAAIVSVPWSVDHSEETKQVNDIATRQLIDIAKENQTRQFVFSSSSAVYGDAGTCPISEKTPTQPMSPYASAKLAAEEYGRSQSSAGFNFTALRYFNVYGARQRPDSAYAAVIPTFMQAAGVGNAPTIYGDGSQTRDFCHVSDVASANLLAAGVHGPGSDNVYNIGSGIETSVLNLWTLISEAASSMAPASHTTKPNFAAPRAGDIYRSCADITAARDALGFIPRMPLAAGLGGF